jgi:hypothetical protein
MSGWKGRGDRRQKRERGFRRGLRGFNPDPA